MSFCVLTLLPYSWKDVVLSCFSSVAALVSLVDVRFHLSWVHSVIRYRTVRQRTALPLLHSHYDQILLYFRTSLLSTDLKIATIQINNINILWIWISVINFHSLCIKYCSLGIMAEFVQQSIEEMVGELHEMQTAGLFDGSEIRYNNYLRTYCQLTWLWRTG